MNKVSFLYIFFFLFLFSCEDFLDKQPLSELTAEMLGKEPGQADSPKINNAEQAEAYLASAYAAFGSEFYQLDIYQINETQSDNAYSGVQTSNAIQLDTYSADAGNMYVTQDWGLLYSQIGTCNVIIQYVPLVEDAKLTESRRKEIVAEASFIRAQCYFNLLRIYGRCPLVLKDIPDITDENFEEIYVLLYPHQASSDAIYKQILDDMQVAEEGVVSYNVNKSNITKPVVYAKLAEIYATMNAPENVNWNKVKEYAQKVTNDSRYGLLGNFSDIFEVEGRELKNKYSKESIFELECVANTNTANAAFKQFTGRDSRKYCTPSKDLIKTFEEEGDNERLNASVLFEQVTWADQDYDSSQYPFCNKIRGNEDTNIILMRLPYVMLLEAEALNELGDIAGAGEIVNRIRKRVNLPRVAADTKETMRLAIERERRLELAFEGCRWFDLKRTGRLYDVMENCSDYQHNYAYRLENGNRWIWPIPQKELNLNSSLTQNEGY